MSTNQNSQDQTIDGKDQKKQKTQVKIYVNQHYLPIHFVDYKCVNSIKVLKLMIYKSW